MKKEVVIIGGGFAGINLVKKLSKEKNIHVTLVDRNNYNFFPPLLYQVATGFIEVSNISYPFRKLFRKYKNSSFRMGELQSIKPNENKVILSNGELSYDFLVIATGTESNYFGMENIRKHALPMKNINDALELRNFLLQDMEDATIAGNQLEQQKRTTIVIAGGGPTGVELAGMLAEMRVNIFEKDYPELKKQKISIFLVDGAESLLSPMSRKSQVYTKEALEKMGVKVILDTQVKDYKNDEVIFSNGESISSKMLIWAAGVTATHFAGIPDESYGKGKRLLVNENNKVHGTKNIYAIGDTSLQFSDSNFPEGHPQLAQVAIQQGALLAKNIKAIIKNQTLTDFSYFDKGSMAIIGRSKAVAEIPKPKFNITGWFAWAMWLFVHLFSLISYRNRIKTMYNWTIAYFTRDQTLRMIIRKDVKVD